MQNILSVEVYKNEGYEGILKYQEEMFFKIYKLLKNKEIKIRIGEKEEVVRADQPSGILNKGLAQLICTVIDQYAYLLM